MIELKHISKSYGDKTILQDYSMKIPEEKCTVIMGPSGCGKTTMLRLIMGLECADCGEIRNVPEKIAAVFQEDRLCEGFSAIENVMLVMNPRKEKEIQERNRCVDAMEMERIIREHLIQLGLCESMEQPVKELSGGMKRRVAIVRAMLSDADLIIMDEPFKGLDIETKQLVMDYVQEQIKGKTCIMVTHDEIEAKKMGTLTTCICI